MELDLLNLLSVLVAAWLVGAAARRLGFPSVLGEILAGIVLGPPLLGILHASDALFILAEIGVLLMMLYVGMEVDPRELGRASWPGLLAAVGGFFVPFVLSYGVIIWFGGDHITGVFVGIASGVTALAVNSRILIDLQLLDTRLAHVLMAAALITDTLALVAFAAILGAVDSGALNAGAIALVALKGALFFAVTAFAGIKLLPLVGKRMSVPALQGRPFHFTLVLIIAVAFGAFAEFAGLHAIVGTFIAGLFLRENVLGRTLANDIMKAVRDASVGFLAPVFFVTAGFAVSLNVFQSDLGLFGAILAAAVMGKFVGTLLFYIPSGRSWREGLALGAGMNGRGAVEIIIAGIGLQLGLITQEIFSILVFMAIITTLSVPVLLKWSTAWLARHGELVRSTTERDGTLIVGAGPLARALAKILARSEAVWLVDSSRDRCAFARSEGLHVVRGSALEEQVLFEANAARAASLIAMTSNAEVNALTTQLAKNVFRIPHTSVIQTPQTEDGREAAMRAMQSTTLFAGAFASSEWDHWISHDEVLRTKTPVRSLSGRTAEKITAELQRGGRSLPVALKRENRYLPFHSGLSILEDDEIIVLSPRPMEDRLADSRDRFDHIVAKCPFLDLNRRQSLADFLEMAIATLALQTDAEPEILAEAFLQRELMNSSVVAPGIAIPHVLVDGDGQFHMLIARCREGLYLPSYGDGVHAVFLIIRSADERTFHLRALSAIAQIVQDPSFDERWLTAWNAEELRSHILNGKRRRLPKLEVS